MDKSHEWRFLDTLEPAAIVWADNLAHIVFGVPNDSHEEARAIVGLHNRVIQLASVPKPNQPH